MSEYPFTWEDVGDGVSSSSGVVKKSKSEKKSIAKEWNENWEQRLATEWLRNRQDTVNGYPPITEQLDKMYHDGFDAWKTAIKVVKDRYPKPS